MRCLSVESWNTPYITIHNFWASKMLIKITYYKFLSGLHLLKNTFGRNTICKNQIYRKLTEEYYLSFKTFSLKTPSNWTGTTIGAPGVENDSENIKHPISWTFFLLFLHPFHFFLILIEFEILLIFSSCFEGGGEATIASFKYYYIFRIITDNNETFIRLTVYSLIEALIFFAYLMTISFTMQNKSSVSIFYLIKDLLDRRLYFRTFHVIRQMIECFLNSNCAELFIR